jgi:hypothetical protein
MIQLPQNGYKIPSCLFVQFVATIYNFKIEISKQRNAQQQYVNLFMIKAGYHSIHSIKRQKRLQTGSAFA